MSAVEAMQKQMSQVVSLINDLSLHTARAQSIPNVAGWPLMAVPSTSMQGLSAPFLGPTSLGSAPPLAHGGLLAGAQPPRPSVLNPFVVGAPLSGVALGPPSSLPGASPAPAPIAGRVAPSYQL